MDSGQQVPLSFHDFCRRLTQEILASNTPCASLFVGRNQARAGVLGRALSSGDHRRSVLKCPRRLKRSSAHVRKSQSIAYVSLQRVPEAPNRWLIRDCLRFRASTAAGFWGALLPFHTAFAPSVGFHRPQPRAQAGRAAERRRAREAATTFSPRIDERSEMLASSSSAREGWCAPGLSFIFAFCILGSHSENELHSSAFQVV